MRVRGWLVGGVAVAGLVLTGCGGSGHAGAPPTSTLPPVVASSTPPASSAASSGAGAGAAGAGAAVTADLNTISSQLAGLDGELGTANGGINATEGDPTQ